jgi:hypothetical protein
LLKLALSVPQVFAPGANGTLDFNVTANYATVYLQVGFVQLIGMSSTTCN